jgi:Uma2 family endonuclease
LREKPGRSFARNRLGFRLGFLLQEQRGWEAFVVGVNGGRVRRSAANFSIPDVFVAPIAQAASFRDRSDVLEVYGDPLPLVVAVWSPSTGAYDVNEKLAEYQARGDREIWRLHPFERTLAVWRRQPDGSYETTVSTGGVIQPVALPQVRIDLTELFGMLG